MVRPIRLSPSWRQRACRTLSAVVALACLSVPAYAQTPATSFTGLSRRIKIGDTATVTTEAGAVLTGRVRSVSQTEIVIRHRERELRLAEADVQRVTRSRHTVKTGALIGLATGALAGVAWASAQDCGIVCSSSSGGVLTFGGLFGAIGLGAGAAIGAAVPGERLVFERRVVDRTRASVMPLHVSARSVSVRFSW